MTNHKQVVVVFLLTTLLIVGLAGMVGYRNGELSSLWNSRGASDIPGPLAPLAASSDVKSPEKNTTTNNQDSMTATHATFKTTKGDVTFELFTKEMPITTQNFLKLAGEGFYNGTKFHRVIDGFMVQGGDPNTKGSDTANYGRGGPGYTIQDEFVAGLSNVRGTIAMANTGAPNSGGSQFFINLVDNVGLDYDKEPLSSSHPVFGRIVKGMEVVDQIAKVATDERDMPVDPVIINSIELSK